MLYFYVMKCLLWKTCFRFYLSTFLPCLILVSIGVWLWKGRNTFLPFQENGVATLQSRQRLVTNPLREDQNETNFSTSSLSDVVKKSLHRRLIGADRRLIEHSPTSRDFRHIYSSYLHRGVWEGSFNKT